MAPQYPQMEHAKPFTWPTASPLLIQHGWLSSLVLSPAFLLHAQMLPVPRPVLSELRVLECQAFLCPPFETTFLTFCSLQPTAVPAGDSLTLTLRAARLLN